MLFFLFDGLLAQTCNVCDHTVGATGGPSPAIPNNANGITVCIAANRTNGINFNNAQNVTVCIPEGVTVNANFNSLTSLAQLNNYGTFTARADYNGSWTINNFGSMTLNFGNLNSGKTINNSGVINRTGNFTINGNFNSAQGATNFSANLTVNSSGTFNIGEGNVGGNIQNNGNINIHGTLDVQGNVTMNSGSNISAGDDNQVNYLSVGGSLNGAGCLNGINGLLFSNLQWNCGNGEVYLGVGSGCLEIIETNPYQQGGDEFFDRIYIFRCSTGWTVPNNTETEEVIDAVDILVVAGGGGGGRGSSAGGGGGGGLIEESPVLTPGSNLPVIVGVGGAGSTNENNRGLKGSNSSFFGFTAEGGGGGGSSGNQRAGQNGGSGGGGAFANGNLGGNGSQGNNGGAGSSNGPFNNGGGGGGSFSAGSNAQNGNNPGGNGGNGTLKNISGSEVIYSAGGGGTGPNGGGNGGSGVGGNGNSSGPGENGNTPGSGGGAGSTRGGNGANGIVIISQTFKILPVEFLHITAEFSQEERVSMVSWATAKEWENSHFEVERSIDNVKSFTKLGEVEGIGYTDDRSDYSFKDNDLPLRGGMAYYRLKQVDFSGTYAYSEIVGVRIPSMNVTNGVWRAFPNPTKGNKLTIDLVNAQEYTNEKITARLVSSLVGSSLIEGKNIREVSEKLSDKLQASPNGLYIIEVYWGEKREYLKVLKN
ncbi:glycine-rich domain-containing protein [Mongoliibacter sp.]|uniref:glycine-rich domain-containing protein n=1 Tax=Mongoliibacter sp. TaxID=2022438 RepID=UPI0025EC7729|nr:hypothetical protein [Mongoliibacter sp.]